MKKSIDDEKSGAYIHDASCIKYHTPKEKREVPSACIRFHANIVPSFFRIVPVAPSLSVYFIVR